MKILIAIIVFSVIILFHELGHFLLAKKNGIKVLEFSLGMGPKTFIHRKGRNTIFSKALSHWRLLYDGGRGR